MTAVVAELIASRPLISNTTIVHDQSVRPTHMLGKMQHGTFDPRPSSWVTTQLIITTLKFGGYGVALLVDGVRGIFY